MDARGHVVEQLEYQAASCRWIGSPLYQRLLGAAAADAAGGGPAWAVLEPYATDPEGSALALRFMAAVHRLVLRGRAPELTAFYPSAGGDAGGKGAEAAFLAVVAEHEETLRRETAQPLQTNEVGRAATLVGGFLTVAARTGLPLRVLEIGASAGLNLRWDHFRYEARGRTWGDPQSPVRLCDFNTESPPPFDVAARVAERRGCDPSPIDARTGDGAILLQSFVWPDQLARLRLLRGAIEVARRVPAPVDEEPASAWLGPRLSPQQGVVTVVFHSIVLQYMDDLERRAALAAIEGAGARATRAAPVAYLRMEPDEDDPKVVEVRLTSWPGGDAGGGLGRTGGRDAGGGLGRTEGREELLAHTGYHGAAVRWLG